MLDKLEVCSYIKKDRVIDLAPMDKWKFLEQMADLIGQDPLIKDPPSVKKAIILREKTMSTGIGEGIAIPHARTSSVDDFVIAFARIREGMEFDAIDGKPVHLVFMIVANEKQDKKYIQLLSKLVLRMKSSSLIEQLMAAKGTEELYRILLETK
ncbi:MAG: transcriptional regulator [Candidatus Cloacimonetes bacterium HGW-Cloacimonetes-3]|jgi:mannitol/fructose-specific phosphotransferase system IIA component (Ntr-type)|nr:MAG: transcriptional regulator [Candidatus Cloacimonetes bacterium HGW-Cloacimonetes-3]